MSDPKPSPDMAEADFGSALRKQRMRRGASLEAAHQATRIPKRLLEAMEQNNADAFPARVYLRGFLKTYCDYLDLEFEPLWEKLSQDAPAPARRGREASRQAGQAKPILLPLTESTLLPFLLFVGLAAAAALFWLFGPSDEPRRREAARPIAPPPALKPLASQPAGEPALALIATADVWLRLKTDGLLRFEGRMPAGTRQDWRAAEAFELKVNDPRALRLELDGRLIGLEEYPAAPDGWHTIRR